MSSSHIIRILPDATDWKELLEPAAEAIRQGKLVVFPTETVYGIAVRADMPSAVELIYRAKQRPPDKPFAYHIGDWNMVNRICGELSPRNDAILHKYLPGPFTFLVDVNDVKTGIRFPEQPVAQCFLSLCDVPVMATSANLSGQPSPTCIEMTAAVIEETEYAIDSGTTQTGIDSTVVDLTTDPPTILRQGSVAFHV
jgi:L-threonylcarbamoyladenylate synthase